MKKETVVTIAPVVVNRATITIEGDTDLVLNKINDRMAWLLGPGKDQPKDLWPVNEYEDVITSMHWRDGKPKERYHEGDLEKALKENAPCLTAFGLKKSFSQSVVQNEIDKYSTKFNAAVNVIGKGGLVPITFAEHYLDEKLMSPQKGRPVLAKLNRFSGWTATFEIQYTDRTYTLNQILEVIKLAGFGIGIGSGRSSGFGRYHISEIKA